MAYDRFRTATPMADWRSFVAPIISDDVDIIIGTLYLVQNTWGMAFNAGPVGAYSVGDTIDTDVYDEYVLVYNAEKILVLKDTATGSGFEVGQKVYVNHVNSNVYNSNAVGRTCIGICTEAAADDDTTVEIDLKGDSMTDQP
jgi:hypothetical protein